MECIGSQWEGEENEQNDEKLWVEKNDWYDRNKKNVGLMVMEGEASSDWRRSQGDLG